MRDQMLMNQLQSVHVCGVWGLTLGRLHSSKTQFASTQLTPNRLNEPVNVSRFGCWEERDDGLDKLSKQRH